MIICVLYLFIYLFLAVLHSLQDLSSSIRDWTQAPAVKALSPNHWTTREFPMYMIFYIYTHTHICMYVCIYISGKYIYCKMITTVWLTLSPHIMIKNFFLWWDLLRFTFSAAFKYDTILSAVVTVLYIISSELIYLITGGLNLLTIFSHFAHPSPPTSGIVSLFSVSMSLALFRFYIQVRSYGICLALSDLFHLA